MPFRNPFGGRERVSGPAPDKVMPPRQDVGSNSSTGETTSVDPGELEAKLAAKYKSVIDYYVSKQNLNKPMPVISEELTAQFTHQGQLNPDYDFVLREIRNKREVPQA